jgi:hypothetical protein
VVFWHDETVFVKSKLILLKHAKFLFTIYFKIVKFNQAKAFKVWKCIFEELYFEIPQKFCLVRRAEIVCVFFSDFALTAEADSHKYWEFIFVCCLNMYVSYTNSNVTSRAKNIYRINI